MHRLYPFRKYSINVFLIVDLCLEGSQWNGTVCVECDVNQYKHLPGNSEPCLPCPGHEVAPRPGARSCGKKLFYK